MIAESADIQCMVECLARSWKFGSPNSTTRLGTECIQHAFLMRSWWALLVCLPTNEVLGSMTNEQFCLWYKPSVCYYTDWVPAELKQKLIENGGTCPFVGRRDLNLRNMQQSYSESRLMNGSQISERKGRLATGDLRMCKFAVIAPK